MANQYHDENGRFCSRNEMAFAIDRLALAGDTDKALGLSLRMSEIQRENEIDLQRQLTEFMGAAVETSGRKTLTQQIAEESAAKQGAPKGRDKVPLVAVPAPDAAVAARDAIQLFAEGDEVEAYATIESFSIEERQAFMVDPDADPDMVAYAMRQGSSPLAHDAVIASGSPAVAMAYVETHGWPEQDEAFERIAFKAEDSESRRTFASYAETPWGIGELLADEKTDSPTLVALAANPNITVKQADMIIAESANHTRLYRHIRSQLLANGAVTQAMYARLKPELDTLRFAPRPAFKSAQDTEYAQALTDASVNIKRLEAAIDNPTISPEQRIKYERALEHTRRTLENIKGEFNASHDRRVAQLAEDVAAGSKSARDDLAAAEGYLLQKADYRATFG
jgi:hypothetical protein